MRLSKIERRIYVFLAIQLIISVLLNAALYHFGRDQIHLFINSHHSPIGDLLFPFITWIGDGITAVILTLIAVMFKIRYGLFIGFSGLLSGLLAQFFKKVVFGPLPRPSQYFEGKNISLHLVENVDLATVYTFPSGHSATAFALMFSIIMISKRRALNIILYGLAIVAAYSRIYLSQHFLEDTIAGSWLGIISAIFCYFIFIDGKFSRNEKLDRPIF